MDARTDRDTLLDRLSDVTSEHNMVDDREVCCSCGAWSGTSYAGWRRHVDDCRVDALMRILIFGMTPKGDNDGQA